MKKRAISFACAVVMFCTILCPKNIVINAKEIEKNNTNDVSNYAAEETFEVELNKDTSYEVKNTTSESKIISKVGSNQKFNYIIYNVDGTIKESSFNNTNSGKTIKQNETIKLSASDENLKINIPASLSGNIVKIETPTFSTLAINLGETYEFSNSNTNGFPIRIVDNTDYFNSLRYDSILYNDKNEIESIVSNKYTSSYNNIKKNYRQKFTMISGDKPIVFYIPYEYKKCYKKIETPTFKYLNLLKGETYEVSNKRSDKLNFKFLDNTDISNDIRYEYVTYNQDNSIDKLDQNVYTLSSGNTLKYGQRKKFTSTSGSRDMTIKVPYEYKDFIKKSETPTLHSIILQKGDTYEIENIKQNLLDLKFLDNTSYDNNRRYDYIKYDKSNNIKEISQNTYSTTVGNKLSPKERKKLTFSYGSSNMVIKVPYEDKGCIKKSETPTFFNLTLNKGDTYKITNKNKDKTDIRMLDNSSNYIRYDYVKYDYDDRVESLGKNMKSDGYTKIAYSKSLKLTFTEGSENMVIRLPYEVKDSFEKLDTPALYKINIKQGETFEVKNTDPSGNDIKIIDNSSETYSDIRYDYISYDKYNRPDRALSNRRTGGNNSIYSGKSIKITQIAGSNDMVVCIPYEHKGYIQKSKTPAFYYTTINKGESYEVHNKLDDEKSIAITDNSSEEYSDLKYDYAVYDKSGAVSDLRHNVITSQNRIVKDGSKIKLTVIDGSEPFILKVPYEYKDFVKKSETPTLYGIKVSQGETYEFKNNTGDGNPIKYWDSSIGEESIRYDIIEYLKSGDVSYNGVNEYSYGLQTVRNESRVKLTLRNSYNPMEIYLPYEYKNSVTKGTTPVFIDKVVEAGKPYEVTNNTWSMKVIFGGIFDNIGSFDYDIYNSKGELLRSKKDFRGNVLLYPSEKVVLRPTDKGSTTFNVQYELTLTNLKDEDINKDGLVDMLDLSLVSSKYNAKINSNDYNARFDINKDGIIDIFDIVRVAKKI